MSQRPSSPSVNQPSQGQTVPLIAPLSGSSFLALIRPHEEGERTAVAMETWFQACSTDLPFALELVGTCREQGFVLRASSQEQLTLLCKQFEAQYPQAQISRVTSTADPLILHPGEHAVIGEFALAAPSYLPLKTFTEKALTEPGADPLAAILAAMETVGRGERVISQLALVRAKDSWIRGDIRKAVEHPLQEERDQAADIRQGHPQSPNAGGLRILVGMLLLFLILVASRWYEQHNWGALLLLASVGGAALLGLFWWWVKHQMGKPMYDMKLVSEKLKRAAFYTQLRVIVIGRSKISTAQHLRIVVDHLEVVYRQFTLASANSLYVKQIRHLSGNPPANHFLRFLEDLTGKRQHAHTLHNVARAFPYHHPILRFLHAGAPGRDVWNSLELSGAFHLPQESADLPLVRRVSVKQLLFSPEISQQIERTPAMVPPTLIGYSKHRGHVSRVLLPSATLFSHKFLVGRSRSGKSVLMQHLIRGAMQPVVDGSPQPGLFVIDPHHDLVMDVLSSIPGRRMRDVLLLDVTDTAYPVGINPLDATMGLTRDQAVSNLMSCFEQVWHEYWGPRMSYFLKAVNLLLYTLNADLVRAGQAHKQYTLLDINPLLQYQDYATKVLSHLDKSEPWHQELLSWWQNVYFTLPRQSSFRQEIIMPILSKMGVFHDNEVLRRIVGQSQTTVPIHTCVTEGKIVLCALSSQDLDTASVNILGSTLINLLHRTFARQQQDALLARRKVFVAIDEFQNFSGSMFDKLLSEDTKFGCAMLLSTQNLKRLNQIKDGLLEMIFSNCENLCAFSVSAADAKMLEEEFRQKVKQNHLLSQPRLHCYARLAMQGYPVQIASVQVALPASWHKNRVQEARIQHIRQLNRACFLSAAAVDQQHAEHLSQFLDINEFADSLGQGTRARNATRASRAKADDLLAHVQNQKASPAKKDSPPTPDPGPSARTAPSTNETSSPATKPGGQGGPQGLRTTPTAFTTAPPTDHRSLPLNPVTKEEKSEPVQSKIEDHEQTEKELEEKGAKENHATREPEGTRNTDQSLSDKEKGRRNHNRRERDHGSRRVAKLQADASTDEQLENEAGEQEQRKKPTSSPRYIPENRERGERRERE